MNQSPSAASVGDTRGVNLREGGQHQGQPLAVLEVPAEFWRENERQDDPEGKGGAGTG